MHLTENYYSIIADSCFLEKLSIEVFVNSSIWCACFTNIFIASKPSHKISIRPGVAASLPQSKKGESFVNVSYYSRLIFLQ